MDFKPGDKFGDRFSLLSKLGSGGLGEAWKAPDAELDRDVALPMPAETPEDQQPQNHVTFLLNFADELQRKVPLGK